MKSLNYLALLLCLTIVTCFGLVNAMKSKSIPIGGLQWGSMGTYMMVNGTVHHLEEDAWLPGNILFSSDYTLMTTDGKTTHLVAGSVSGYGEGELARAKFGVITGFLQTSSNKILVVDFTYNCLRYIDRITNLTSPFVGICNTFGFKDGLYGNARFHDPWSVISNPKNLNEAIVTDNGNGAIRAIDLAKGEVLTIFSGLAGITDASFDSDKETFFFLFSRHLLGKYNMKTKEYLLIPMSKPTSAGMDGHFSTALLYKARGILCLNKGCLVADRGYHRLRILDVEKQMVYSICTGNNSLTNGPTAYCSLRSPSSLLLKSGTLYIGESGAIRNISLGGFFPCEDTTVRLSSGEQRKCIEVTPGQHICLTPGIFMYNIPEKNCTIKISIIKELDACENMPCLNSGLCKAERNNSYTCTCRDGWTGRNCQSERNVCTINPCRNLGSCSVINNTFACSCKAGWTGYVCEKELDLCHSNPCLHSGICSAGDNDTYVCICRGRWTGRNCETEMNICSFSPCKNAGVCRAINNTFVCSCAEGWIGITCERDVRNATCVREIYGAADVNTKQAEIKLPDGNKIKLPVGKVIYQQQLPDQTTCEITLTVTDPMLKTRIDFSVKYKLLCNHVNDFKDLTLSLAKTRYPQITQLSSELCNRPDNIDVMISCTKDVVNIIWPTDCLFDGSQYSEMEKAIKVIQNNLLKTKVFQLELVIPSHIPPIVQPTLSMEGYPVSVMQTLVCSGGLKYLNTTGACQ